MEACRSLGEAGVLEAVGATRGECVNILKGASSEQASNAIAGFCGQEGVQAAVQTTNKGQCIKVLKPLLVP